MERRPKVSNVQPCKDYKFLVLILICGTISTRTVIITSTAGLLLKNKTRVCGTIRINRGLPPNLKAKASRMKKGDTVFCRKDTGKKNRKTGEDIVKPVCINQYNVHMKGVERADQYLSYYPILRKTMKWTKKVVLYLINCGLFNCFRIYNVLNPEKKIKYKQFLLLVAKCWIVWNVGVTMIMKVV